MAFEIMAPHQSTQEAHPAVANSPQKVADLACTACVELGFEHKEAMLIAGGQHFRSPSGLICRLRPDGHEPESGLRAELELPLLLQDLGPPQMAMLLNLQTVLVITAGWVIAASPDDGPLYLSTLASATTATKIVGDLSAGSVLAKSVLQMLIADPEPGVQPHAA